MKLKFLCPCFLLVALALSGCPFSGQKGKEKKAAATAKKQAAEADRDVDFQAFLGRLRLAVKAHDLNAIASMMTVDFGYRLNPEGSGPGVFQYWDENNLWLELDGVLAERFVPKGDVYMVAPPQFADQASQYDGYRAGIRRINGSWKFAYFVNG